MPLAKDRSRINVKGGGDLRVRPLKPTPVDTWLVLGYQGGTTVNDEYGMVECIDEAGLQIEFLPGQEIVKISGTLMQSSIDEINHLKTVGTAWEMYYKVILANGNIQEYNFPLVRFKFGPALEMAANKLRGIPFEARALAVKATWTRTPTNFNITADQAYVLTENAAAVNPPSDTAANVVANLW